MVSINPRLFQADDLASLRSLHETVFGPWPGDLMWNWKYSNGQHGIAISTVVQNQRGDLIGHAGARFCWGLRPDGLGLVGQVMDVMVHPQVRGHRVFQCLLDFILDQLFSVDRNMFVYGFAGLRPFRLGARLGYYHPISALYPVGPVSSAQPQSSKQSRPMEVADLTACSEQRAKDILFPLTKRLGPFPTFEYLKWRYLDHPQRLYKVVTQAANEAGIVTQVSADVWWSVEGIEPDWAWSWRATHHQDRGFGLLSPEPIMISGQVTPRGVKPRSPLLGFTFRPGDTDVF